MIWLRERWQRTSARYRLAWVVGIVVGIGLIANLLLHRDAISYAGTFVATGPMTTAREGATATLLADGRVLIAGGSADGTSVLGSAELYDPATGTFGATGSMTTPRISATAVPLPDGRVLVCGGNGPGANPGVAGLSSAELYDPHTGTFTATGSMATPRAYGSMTVLGDGRVLVAGGSNAEDRLELAAAEVYDPNTGTFTKTGSLVTGREGAAAALLPDGRVLVAGGAVSIDASTAADTPSAELYDPMTGSFATTGSMAAALDWRSATLLIDGRVLLAGGRGVGPLLDGTVAAEVYDPATGAFSPTGSMHTRRIALKAVGLDDGRVLLVDGQGSAELYDPLREAFTGTATMLGAHGDGTVTILANGRVLVAGGTAGVGPIASAELFQ